MTDQRPPSKLWWVYFGYLVLAGILGAAPYLAIVRQGSLSPRQLALPAGATLLNLLGIVGLWAYIRSRPVGAVLFWRVCLLLTAAQIAYVAYLFGANLTAGATGVSRMVAVWGLGGLLLALPLLFALWRYAYRSPEIWRGAVSA